MKFDCTRIKSHIAKHTKIKKQITTWETWSVRYRVFKDPTTLSKVDNSNLIGKAKEKTVHRTKCKWPLDIKKTLNLVHLKNPNKKYTQLLSRLTKAQAFDGRGQAVVEAHGNADNAQHLRDRAHSYCKITYVLPSDPAISLLGNGSWDTSGETGNPIYTRFLLRHDL